jgi:glutamyl-tRNA(Gln) amidotransferase subunit E
MVVSLSSLGLKSGIEIHEQLDTSHKLFCSCPTKIRDDKPDVVINRNLRASAGETGELDVAAAYEQLRGKSFVYQAYNDTVCDVELDEEPIHNMDEGAIKISLQVALLLKAKPVDHVQVMRKTVVDGSNTSGFQRTALLATNGIVTIGGIDISISSVCSEEESAKIVNRSSDHDTYNLSRLGIPLVEIATGPDMKTPEQVREVAEHIGMILRSTGKVKRGLGTIRQDVNVSIKEGARVEIKGAQDLKMIAKLVEYEALRQKGLVDVATGLKDRSASVKGKVIDVTKEFSNTNSKIVKNTTVLATNLSGFKGLILREFLPEGSPERRLGKEFSEYAKAHAGVGGVLHSDELPNYGITEDEVNKIKKAVGCKENDAFVMVASTKEKAEKGINSVIKRAEQAIKGVPSEVRKANDDGTTTFLRPMPGSARMYPETDVAMINISEHIKGIELPELLSKKASGYEKLGLSKDLSKAITNGNKSVLFEKLATKCKNLSPSYIAEILISNKDGVTDEILTQLLTAVNSGTIAKESVADALADAAKTGKLDISKYSVMSDSDLEKELQAIIAKNKGLPLNATIGKAMQKLRGKAPGKKIVEKLKSLMS